MTVDDDVASMSDLLVYGSYGYTGRLVAETAVERGLDPTLSGRNRRRLRDQADDLGCAQTAFALDDASTVESAVADADAVLNCAGPFAETAEPMVDACLATGTHYLDITGEIDVFEAIADRDGAGEAADVTLLPGVGFDVVPTDCLAAHLADRLPDATELTLGFQGLDSVSPGTAKTTVGYLGEGGLVRRDGRLERVAPGSLTRRIDFGRGPITTAAIPWGDVSTAYHTTGIPNVEVYMALPTPAIWAMRAGSLFSPLLGAGPVQSALRSLVDATVSGPDERERERGRSLVWGEARTEAGERVVSRLETPETYALTAETAVEIAARVLDGDAPTGYQTPAGAFGPDLILDFPGTTREDVC
jgi:short subunit dehydrogenase-like uncharacterized protein